MFNELSMHLFNESNAIFNVIVTKPEFESIYSDDLGENKLTGISSINFKLVNVEKVIKQQNTYMYKINYNNKIIGYIHSNDCLLFLPKENEQVRFKQKVNVENIINSQLNLNGEVFEEAKYKICYSRNSIIYNDEIYESVYFADRLVGFFTTSDLYKLKKVEEKFEITEETNLYKDSFMLKEVINKKPSKTIYNSSMVIYELNIVRFKINGKNLWMSMECTDLVLKNTNFNLSTPSELLIKSIIFQYEDKLDKSHMYYVKILNQELSRKE